MKERDLDSALLERLLDAVGAHLQAQGLSASVVVVGGAALCLRGWVRRTTSDVDVIAVVPGESGGEWVPPDMEAPLLDATRRVARDFNLETNWFNGAVGCRWKTGLPDSIQEDVDWVLFRGLHVGLAGRQTLITLKLFASADHGPESVHLQDLLALSPTDDELERAARWVRTQDLAPQFPAIVAEVVSRVRANRQPG